MLQAGANFPSVGERCGFPGQQQGGTHNRLAEFREQQQMRYRVIRNANANLQPLRVPQAARGLTGRGK